MLFRSNITAASNALVPRTPTRGPFPQQVGMIYPELHKHFWPLVSNCSTSGEWSILHIKSESFHANGVDLKQKMRLLAPDDSGSYVRV